MNIMKNSHLRKYYHYIMYVYTIFVIMINNDDNYNEKKTL